MPLLKEDKALRPIACSETLRRVAAKLLASRWAKKFRSILVPHGQIGVAVSSGLEALSSFTRRVALGLEPDEAFAKIDFRNAFNSVTRHAIAAAVLRYCPEVARYVEAAYGDATTLICGSETVSSETGVQQGDPLGPALFSLAALAGTVLPPELSRELTGVGWYLDDGMLVGPAPAVHKALLEISEKSALIGLSLNTSKTEILSGDPTTWANYRGDFPCWRPLGDLELLGLPCSPSEEGLAAYVEKFLSRLDRRTSAIRAVCEHDPSF